MADIVFPPLLHFRQGAFIDLEITLTGVRCCDDDGATDQACLIQIFFIADGIQLVMRGDLSLQARIQLLDVLAEMYGNVPCDQLDSVGGTMDRALVGELVLEIHLLSFRESDRDPVEPAIDRRLIDRQFRHPLFIQQRHHGFIFHSALHGVCMHNRTEFVGGLFILE